MYTMKQSIMLRESCVTVTQKEWNSTTEKMSETLTGKNI